MHFHQGRPARLGVYCSGSIAGKPVWWVLVMFVSLVNLILSIAVAENFGQGARCGLELAFFPFIFYPMLGFGDAQYRGVMPTIAVR